MPYDCLANDLAFIRDGSNQFVQAFFALGPTVNKL